ncbi:hypothetical protein MBRA1_002794 [Malassezia brasiliensis]|uniref:RRM domain-containing protein n=1 Tax=Malassezia brasiliensis TaxID=1821822 RepID=A0AAF0ITQ6_9BASI|nr:hypothetical protein MBRA1_002794 [Malassezia brasiliensis]
MRNARGQGRVPAALNLASSAHDTFAAGAGVLDAAHAAEDTALAAEAAGVPRAPSSALGLGAFAEAQRAATRRMEGLPRAPSSATFPHFPPSVRAQHRAPTAEARAASPVAAAASLAPATYARARSSDTRTTLPSPSFPRRPMSSADTRGPAAGSLLRSDPASPALREYAASSASHTPRLGAHGARFPYTAAAAAASDQRTQLHVRNLPYSVRWQDVKDLFRRAGTVLRADVHLTADNRSCGTGTVLFATEDDALRAVDALHGYTWQGRVLDVQLESPSRPSSGLAHHAPGGTASPASPRVGGVESLPLPPPPPLRFVPYTTPSDAEMAWPPMPMAPMPPHAPPTAPPALPFPGRVLFIGNLPFNCQWQDLKDLFRAAGNIQRADVALNADGRSRGFGTVLFASPEDAQNAVRLYHGYELNGRVLKVHFDRLAHYGPVHGIPTEPAQYTAAFASPAAAGDAARRGATAIDGESLVAPSGRPSADARVHASAAAAASAAGAAAAAHWHEPHAAPAAHGGARRPERIALPPPAPTVPPAAGTPGLGVPMTPGMPGFLMRPVLDTPPLYPSSLLSPGAGPWSPAGGAPPMVLGGMPAPYGSAAPGAPLDYLSSMTMPYTPGAELGGMHGINSAAFFPHAANLPPTPHWSQPVRPRQEAPVLTPAALGDVQPTPGAPHAPHGGDANAASGAGEAADEYPFPSVPAPTDTTPTPARGAEPSGGATPTGATPMHAPPAPGVHDLNAALASLDIGARAPTPRDVNEKEGHEQATTQRA